MSKPIALVIGATGAQGGSVARALEGDYKIRTISRDPTKESAQKLIAAGYEVIKGNINDAAVVTEALKGAEVVFLVTQFWETFNVEQEVAEAKTFIDCVAAADPRPKFIFSTLEDVAKESKGEIPHCAHFNGKGQAWDYCQSKGVEAVGVMLAAYHQNFLGFFTPREQDGKLAITLPSCPRGYNSVDVSETGLFVKALLPRYQEFVGKRVPLVSDLEPMSYFMEALSKATGKTVVYNEVPASVFATFGFPGAEDLADMFRWYGSAECDRDTKLPLSLVPGATKFAAWAEKNGEAIKKAWKLE